MPGKSLSDVKSGLRKLSYCSMHSGLGWGNFATRPQIFVFKIEPGARSYMSGDPFGTKKPSISPYWDFAVTWQTSSWLKNGDFSRKKMVLALWSIADSRIHLFWLSWAHMKAVICALLAKVKKMEFDGIWAVYHTIIA